MNHEFVEKIISQINRESKSAARCIEHGENPEKHLSRMRDSLNKLGILYYLHQTEFETWIETKILNGIRYDEWHIVWTDDPKKYQKLTVKKGTKK